MKLAVMYVDNLPVLVISEVSGSIGDGLARTRETLKEQTGCVGVLIFAVPVEIG